MALESQVDIQWAFPTIKVEAEVEIQRVRIVDREAHLSGHISNQLALHNFQPETNIQGKHHLRGWCNSKHLQDLLIQIVIHKYPGYNWIIWANLTSDQACKTPNIKLQTKGKSQQGRQVQLSIIYWHLILWTIVTL